MKTNQTFNAVSHFYKRLLNILIDKEKGLSVVNKCMAGKRMCMSWKYHIHRSQSDSMYACL